MYEPAFEIGQKVWLADVKRTPMQLDCPDCKGSKQWMAETANGEKIAIQCPRCQQTGILRDLRFPDLRVVKIETSVTELTISEFHLESATAEGPRFIYMCPETSSNGSGSFYSQGGDKYAGAIVLRGLYGSRDEAEVAAETMRGDQQGHEDQKTAMQIVKDSSTRPFKVVVQKCWWRTIFDAWYAAGKRKSMIQHVLETVKGLSDEMIQELEDTIEDKPWRKTGPLERLVAAAEAIVEGESGNGAESGWIELKELKDALAKITPTDEVLYG